MVALPFGCVTGAQSSSDAKGCIKITTGTGNNHDGRVTVYANQGQGFEAATPVNKRYDKGAIVLDACYANLKAVRMQNTDNDAWKGSVTFARDKAGPYKPGYCATCTRTGSSAVIVVDGNGDGATPTACQNGKMCDITFSLSEAAGGK